MKKKAFTLVEIMAVVALIAILFVIFIPRIGFAANKTKITGVQTDFNSYRVAMQTTAMENSGFGGSEDAAKTGLNKVLDAELQLKPTSAKKDPWGNPYEAAYTNAPDEMITISSKGIDGKEPLSISCIYKNGEVQFETVGPPIGGKPSKPSESAEINETVFTYSDGTTQTVDVVGILAGPKTKDENWNPVGSSYTVPQGATLTGVKIGRHVTTIGDYAFYLCTSLTSVTIQNGVTTIGDYAFYLCTSLTSVTIQNGVTTIGESAFGSTSLTSITIPNSVTTIGWQAFGDCSSLTSIDIPNSVTKIGGGAFQSCSSLTSVTISSSVTTIGEQAFDNCKSLTSIKVASDNPNYKDIDGVLFSKDGKTLIQYPSRKSGVYTIPSGVTTIKDYAFWYCTSLTSVTIPSSVTTIGMNAFFSCKSLTSVNIPNGVTTIGSQAFQSCTSLASVTIPNSVTTIERMTFADCTSLTSVNIPSSVVSIGSGAFWYCTSLTSVTIPSSVTTIGMNAFFGCSKAIVYYSGSATGKPWGAKECLPNPSP